MSNDHCTKSSTSNQSNSAAKNLAPDIRKKIGVSALAGSASITDLSREHRTSRKFVYNQKDKAASALDDAFSNGRQDSEVLCYLPALGCS